ncbi:hypothetical protein BAXH7_02611 [Bacillus amyloliquefaciens XH7]|nr:hypothetical protein BAXH7_02611 [Bacillus amyloliquefaciens XH7]KYC95572.1 hypothetical protein B425_2415 [Bacillus amyloliquefaciens]QBG56998.1 hypothetical protein D2M30_2670 [Bacillus amyloliquefaciens]
MCFHVPQTSLKDKKARTLLKAPAFFRRFKQLILFHGVT